MWNEEKKEYSAPPPSYPCIQGNPSTRMNLDDFRMMHRGKKEQVFDLNGWCEFFGISVSSILEEHCKKLTIRKVSTNSEDEQDYEEDEDERDHE